MKRRIALIAWECLHSIPVGGMAAHVTGLSTALHALGHEVHVFTRLGAGQRARESVEGVHVHRCTFDPHCDFPTYVDRMCDSMADALEHVEAAEGRPFDVVHGHDWLAVRALRRLKGRLGRPVVLTLHSTEYGRCGNALHEGWPARVRELEWEGTYLADRVICVSGALRDEVRWLYQTPDEKTTVIYNGVDIHRFDADVDRGAVRRRHSIGLDDPLVLFVGRLAWQKGPDLLLEAVPPVLQDHRAAKFVYAGEGDMRRSLEDRARSLRLDSSVRFVGQRTGRDLVGLFRAADTVCIPSRNEPFGIVVLEAWSARRPVVVTRCGGPAEFVRNHQTGFTVEPDQEEIRRGLAEALGDPSRADQMGQNGRREAEVRFTWEVIAAQTDQLYDSVLP